MRVLLPSLNGLHAFEAAARLQSCTRAAAELQVTRTAVSHQILRLEAQLGVRLFVRGARGLALTADGADYLPEVRAAFAKLRAATDDLRRSRRKRVVRVGATPTLAAKWLLPRLASFLEGNPGIDVSVNASMRLVDLTREGMDLAIRYGRGYWHGLRAERLSMSDDFFPVCSPALLRGSEPLRVPSDLASHTLLYVEHERYEWQSWLDAAGVRGEMQGGLTFDVAYMALQAAIDGLGVALGYRPYVTADIAAGRLVAPFEICMPATAGFDAYVVCPEAAVLAPDANIFRDWLLASAGR